MVSIKRWDDPVGNLSFDLAQFKAETGQNVLTMTADGGLVLGLAAGDPDRPELTAPEGPGSKISYWQIEHLSLELTGTITP